MIQEALGRPKRREGRAVPGRKAYERAWRKIEPESLRDRKKAKKEGCGN